MVLQGAPKVPKWSSRLPRWTHQAPTNSNHVELKETAAEGVALRKWGGEQTKLANLLEGLSNSSMTTLEFSAVPRCISHVKVALGFQNVSSKLWGWPICSPQLCETIRTSEHVGCRFIDACICQVGIQIFKMSLFGQTASQENLKP